MIKKILTFVLAASVFASTVPTMCAAENAAYIYVSPNGNDNADGSEENPLKTIYAAVDKVSAMPKTNDIHVVFKEGRYEFDKTAEFDDKAAGNGKSRIYYEAAEGEKVVFTGGKQIDTTKFATVTDEDILRRLPQNSRGKVVSLDLKKQGIETLERVDFKRSANSVEKEYYSLYLNGKREMMSQWPNGENNYTAATDVLNERCFRYTETNPLRWGEADQMYIAGWLGHDYSFERAEVESIDFEESTITMKPTRIFPVNSTCAKRWQAFNLLEEIDIPGEWFIDVNTYTLYYYPHENFSNDDLMEMSFFNQPMLRFTEFSKDYYTTFDGIIFTQTRDDVITGGGRNITMTDCTLSYIDADAVTLKGTCNTFEGNRFIYISGYAFEIMNYGQFCTDDEHYVIKNNYLTKCALYVTTSLSAISTSGHHFVIENNVFHNQYGGAAALGWETAEAKVRYNEVYNCERELSDCGTFYCGRQYGDPRNEFAYNLIYDVNAKSEYLPNAVAIGIYMDDTFSGAYIHHNIIKDVNYSGVQIGGGQNNIVENNVIINAGNGPILTDNRGEVWDQFVNGHATYIAQAAAGMARGDFGKKYPWMADGINYPCQPIHDVFRYNISDKQIVINERMAELGTVKNNIKVDNFDDFVDPEHYDFRIKKGSKLDKLSPDGLNEENFSMDMIGITKEVIDGIPEEYKTFEKLYPADGQKDINADGLILTWNEAVPGDEYRVVIAEDPELKNVVADFIAPYTFCKVEDYVKSGEKTYYWKVTAINKSVNHSSEWDCNDGISSFTTTKYDLLDKTEFELAISQMKNLLANVTPQTYYENYINAAKTALDEVVSYSKRPENEVTREGIKTVLSNLDDAKSKLKKGRIVAENVWDGDMFTASAWNIPEGTVVVENEDEISFEAVDTRVHVSPCENPSEDVLQTFDMKIDFDPNSNAWEGLEMQRIDLTKDIWSNDQGYLIVIKKNQSEVQKYKGQGGGIIDTIVDDVFADGEFHKVNIGVIQEVGSTKFIFKVDDTPYFEYTDFNPFTEKGVLFDLRVAAKTKITVRKHISEEKSDTGTWHDALYLREFTPTLNGTWNDDKTASNAAASADCDFTMGEGTYAIFCEKSEIEKADSAAKYVLDVDYVKGREGDERQYTGTIDFSDTDGKWAYIGTYKDVLNGAKIKIQPTDGKNIYGGKIRVVRLENGYEDLAALLETDNSAAVFKVGSLAGFVGQNKATPTAEPEMHDGKAMLPLKSVCEILGMTVVWNDDKQCAEVTDKIGTVHSFAENADAYTKDGSMFVSAEKIAEILGKTVTVNGDGVVIISKVAPKTEMSFNGLFN